MDQVGKGPDGRRRCQWSLAAPEFPEYMQYHDHEWGLPVCDDVPLFEKLCLESFQSGLSWRTVLAKRAEFCRVFKGFDFNQVARFTQKDVERLLKNEGIIRHRGKIEAVINNAKCAIEMARQEGSLADFFWRHEPKVSSKKDPLVSVSKESIALAKELKKRGWKFVGPTTVYAFMQAIGLVNDHAKKCSFRPEVVQVRKRFTRP